MSKVQRDILMCLAAVLIMWLLFFILVSKSSAQEADRWFVLDKFSGLNLYSEKTQLQPNQALYAKNIQFSKPGTISVIDGLTKRDSLSGTQPYLGGNWTYDDSTRITSVFLARDSFLYTTWPATMSLIQNYAENGGGLYSSDGVWRHWNPDSTRVEDTARTGRAAEFWRAGWLCQGDTAPYPTISYISDNSTIFLSGRRKTATGSSTNIGIIPLIGNRDKPVSFVPVDIAGDNCFVILQAGMEPMISTDDPFGIRYLGVADSGTVERSGYAKDTTGIDTWSMFIDDASKVGLYGEYEMGPGADSPSVLGSGYWIHLPFRFADTDSSVWGRVYRIDSNTIVPAKDSTAMRIWFSLGRDTSDLIAYYSASVRDSMKGSRYQILSAPFMRDVLTNSSSPSAKFLRGGAYVITPKTSYSANHIFDQMPHMLFFGDRPDSIGITLPDPFGGGPFWTYWMKFMLVGEIGHPIRCSYVDSSGGEYPDSTVIRLITSNILSDTAFTFTSSDWWIRRMTIPFASDGVVYSERLFLAGDPQDPNFIAYSEPFRVGDFPAANALSLSQHGDVFTGFAQIYDWLVIFQKEHTWLLKGDPTEIGPELALPDEGCIASQSIVELENKIIYLSRKGWRIFDGNTSRDFAVQIKPAVQGLPRVSYSVNQKYKTKSVAAYDPTTGNVWMSMPMGADTVNSGSFLYNYVDGSFSYSDEVYGDNILTLPYRDTLYLMFTNKGKTFTYGYRDSLNVIGVDRDSMQTQWSSGWLDMGAPYQEKKIAEGVAHVMLSSPAESLGNTRFFVRMYRDFDTTAFYADTTNVVGIYGGKHYEVETSVRLEPPADSSTVQWLRVEFAGSGLNLMDVRRLALRYALGGDVIRDRTKAIRP